MVFAWLALLSLGLVWAGLGQADSDRKLTTFDEINVQRINVVEPDGKPRVIVANRAHAAGLYWEGKEHKHPSRSNGGFWFMNDDGDEVGGLTFGSGRLGEQYGASSRLTFDQYKQDETVSLAYQDSNGQRRVGLHVWDRSDKSMGLLIPLVDRLARATSDEERRQVRQEMAQMEEGYRSGYGEAFLRRQDARRFARPSGGQAGQAAAAAQGRQCRLREHRIPGRGGESRATHPRESERALTPGDVPAAM